MERFGTIRSRLAATNLHKIFKMYLIHTDSYVNKVLVLVQPLLDTGYSLLKKHLLTKKKKTSVMSTSICFFPLC